MAGLDLKGAIAAALLLAACGTEGPASQGPLGERLRGSWFCDRAYPDRGFLRAEIAKLDMHPPTLHLSYNVSWECDPAGPCPGGPPDAIGGYFEGSFRDLGDSLALRDALDTVSFREVTDTGFTLLINGRLAFPMRRR